MDYLRIGHIARPHGVHGAIKVTPLCDDSVRFEGLKAAFIERNGTYEPVTVGDVGVQPDAVYLSVSCAQDRDAAERLKGAYLCVDRAHAVKLPEGSWFVAELIGCDVSDTEGNALGRLTDVLETGSADVYVICGKRRLLVPALKRLLHSVDVKNKRIVLDKTVLEEVGLFED